MKFRGSYAFLSNFYPCIVRLAPWWLGPVECGVCDTFYFPSVEHAYQAAKCQQVADIKAFQHGGPGEAKRLGGFVDRRLDWDRMRVPVMKLLLKQKFSHPGLTEKLIGTGTLELVEENDWGDQFWGMCAGTGENQLGKLLMEIRYSLINVVDSHQ